MITFSRNKFCIKLGNNPVSTGSSLSILTVKILSPPKNMNVSSVIIVTLTSKESRDSKIKMARRMGRDSIKTSSRYNIVLLHIFFYRK